LAHPRLAQQATARAHQQAGTAIGGDGIDGAGDHVRLHHHAGAAAGGGIVDRAVPVGGVFPDVDRRERPQASGSGLAGEAGAQRSREHAGKNGEYGCAPHGW